MIRIDRVLHLLLYLSALIGILPVQPYLAWWVQLILLIGMVCGISGYRQNKHLLSKTLATVLSFGFFFVFLLQARLNQLAEPLIQFLCLLLAVRLASDKSSRNMLQMFLLATIILAASSMLTLDMIYLLYLVVLVLLVTSGLILLSFYASDPHLRFNRTEWRLLWKTLIVLPIGSLSLMLILFVILPRTQTPLWNFLNPRASSDIGMSDKISPGSVADLSQSGKLAFRAESDPLPPDSLYWRGIVLNHLDGQTWIRTQSIPAEKFLPGGAGDFRLRIFAEAKADSNLVTLDHPRLVEQIRHNFSSDGVARERSGSGKNLSYLVLAQIDAHSRLLGQADIYLQLPAKLSQRLLATGHDIGKAAGGFQGKVDRLEEFFLQQQLSFSDRKLPLSENPVEDFLFESKRGYCEYFASSYALLLRIAGVPSRLVGGYLGGNYNQFGGYYLVSEDLAHVWVEALDDQGVWQRLDPSRLAINADQGLLQVRRRGLDSFQIFADAMLYSWNRLVLSYDLRQQFELVSQIRTQLRELKKIRSLPASYLLWGALPLLLVGIGVLFRRRRTSSMRLITAYRRRLARCCGVSELPDELGLFALAKRTGASPCQEFARIYGGAIYQNKSLSSADYRRLKAIIRTLKRVRFPIEVANPGSDGDNVSSSNPS